jgi:hypothetical protein
MQIMTDKLDVTQPDPAWAYAQVWASLHKVKAKIDSAIELITGKEESDNKTDEQLREILELVLGEIDEVLEFDLAEYLDDE